MAADVSEDRRADLVDWLSGVVGRPGSVGISDCFAFVEGWVVRRKGLAPLDDLRAGVDDEQTAAARLADLGGVVRAFRLGARRFGLARAAAPALGDVCLVGTETGPIPGIILGERVALRAARGVATVMWPPRCAFRVP